jgi:hypothetical protein
MLNQKCQHKEWLLVKIRGMRDFKIWQCKQCKLLLKERTKGSHEVFILRNDIKKPNELSLKALSAEVEEIDLPSEIEKAQPITSLSIAFEQQHERHS